jgi:hypothetical protein
MAAFGERSEDKIAQIFFRQSTNYKDLVLEIQSINAAAYIKGIFLSGKMATAAIEAGSRPDRTHENNMNSKVI